MVGMYLKAIGDSPCWPGSVIVILPAFWLASRIRADEKCSALALEMKSWIMWLIGRLENAMEAPVRVGKAVERLAVRFFILSMCLQCAALVVMGLLVAIVVSCQADPESVFIGGLYSLLAVCMGKILRAQAQKLAIEYCVFGF